VSLKESIIKLFGPKDAAARLADIETKHQAASENTSIARTAFAEASLAVEAGVHGADRQLAKARDALATAEVRLTDLEAARSIARRAVEEAADLVEDEATAQRWAEVDRRVAEVRAAGQEIEDLIERLVEAQSRMIAAAETARREIPISGETRDAISADRLEALLRVALFKAGFGWALRSGLTPHQAPEFGAELNAAIAAFTKYAPARDPACAA
jgi:hypothetical protein